MDFFQAQEDARKRTKWLVVYFMLAVVGVILGVYVLVVFLSNFLGGRPRELEMDWSWELFGGTAVVVGGAILLGSLFKTLSLAGGGAVVARDLGGRQVDPATRDPAERRLLNVVEEMAIASGMITPQVWVLDHEENINAFAAGTEPANAVVAVSRGCLEQLNRNELQGVIGHEFSHILNGDMKMNMRLIGWLFGILMLSIAGRILLQSLHFARGSRDRNSGGLVIAMLAAGIGLLVIGGIGVFFGRLIQAAISRQREYLADAAAVQFTRDPGGIGGALKKIGGSAEGAKISAPKASEASHLFFASAGLFSFGFATHPPLDERIRAVDPNWDGKFVSESAHAIEAQQQPASRKKPPPIIGGIPGIPGIPGLAALAAFDAPDVARGAKLHRSLNKEWLEAVHSIDDAQAVIYGLLMTRDPARREKETTYLLDHAGELLANRADHWRGELAAIHSAQKIALIELSVASLRRLAPKAYASFKDHTRWLIASDGQIDLFEFMLQKLIERHLDISQGVRQPTPIQIRNIHDLEGETNLLVSSMAYVGGQPAGAYAAAMADFAQHGGRRMTILPHEQCGLEKISAALDTCDGATPLVKRQLLRLCALAAANDASLGNREIELLRAIADSIGCQIPLATTESLTLSD
jgi:Zn-dependent protease with chaperone function